MKSIVFIGVVLALGALAGCSVQNKIVPARPPAIDKQVFQFSTEEGRLQVESLSVILHDPSWTEAEAEKQMSRIAVSASTYEEKNFKAGIVNKKAEAYLSAFIAEDCVKKFGKNKNASPDVFSAIEFEEGFENDSAFKKCFANQEARLAMKEESDNLTIAAGSALGELMEAAGAANLKSAEKVGTELQIDRARDGKIEVSIQLNRFAGSDRVQSTASGDISVTNWDSAERRLKFAVKNIDHDGKNVDYNFSITRIKDVSSGKGCYPSIARFSGDVIITHNGKPVQGGSVSVLGTLTPPPTCDSRNVRLTE